MSESDNYIYLDSGRTIARINKTDTTIEHFEYENKNQKDLEIGNAQNIMYGKFLNDATDLYMSMFPISSEETVLKILTPENYLQYYVPLTEVRFFMENGLVNVIGFSDNYATLKHITLDISDTGVVEEKLVASYELESDFKVFPSSYFYYDGILSTISVDSEQCSINLVKFDELISSEKLDIVTECDDLSYFSVGDNYEVSSVYENTLILDVQVSEPGKGVKEVIFYQINLEDMSFVKVNTPSFVEDVGYNNRVQTFVSEGNMYIASDANFFFTSIYEVSNSGEISKIDSIFKIKGLKRLKSFLP